jgi:hypothetical protein
MPLLYSNTFGYSSNTFASAYALENLLLAYFLNNRKRCALLWLPRHINP